MRYVTDLYHGCKMYVTIVYTVYIMVVKVVVKNKQTFICRLICYDQPPTSLVNFTAMVQILIPVGCSKCYE